MRYPSGLLHKRLRGKELVYVVHTLKMTWGEKDMLFTYALTEKNDIEDVTNIMNQAFNEIKSLITPNQFDLAKSQVLFNFQNIRQNSASKVTNILYHSERFGSVSSERKVKEILDQITIDDIYQFLKISFGDHHVFQFSGL